MSLLLLFSLWYFGDVKQSLNGAVLLRGNCYPPAQLRVSFGAAVWIFLVA
jgi:hypothetical protein